MDYQITSQYVRDTEKFIAVFHDSQDAVLFFEKKIALDQARAKQRIHRLYGNFELIREFNFDHIPVMYAQYADGVKEFESHDTLLYTVTIQTENMLHRKEIAFFSDLIDAQLFIVEKCRLDKNMEDSVLFSILQDQVVVQNFNKQSLARRIDNSSFTETFHPTPMPMKPRPPGIPNDSWINPEDEEDM